jgi:hypothetical protein
MLIFYCYFANKIFQLQPFQFHLIELQTIVSSGKTMVYDALRKKHVLLTPEEEVRQKLIIYLLQAKKVPAALIAIERGLKINGMMKRFDLVIYNSLGEPHLAIECKAPSVALTQNTLQQLATYNLHLKAEFLMVSNGLKHLICQVNFETREINFLDSLPI